MGPIIALFVFTMRQTLLNRKIWLTVFMLVAPCALVVVVRSVAPPETKVKSLWEMYHVLSLVLLMSGLVPLVCMVHGTALIGSDVEARTIVYLITRRMRRVTVMLVKFFSTGVVLALLCDLGMVCLHLCAMAGRDLPAMTGRSSGLADWNPTSDLLWYLLIIPLGVFSLLAVFNLIGLLTARPLAISVLYLVTVELILSNIPIRAARFSVGYHLRATVAGVMPRVPEIFDMPSSLRDELYAQGSTTLPGLLGIILVALVLSGFLVTVRELVPTKVSRE